MFNQSWQIASYQLAAREAALRLEVETGLGHSRGSVMMAVKKAYGIHGGTKKNVLADLQAYKAGWDLACDWSLQRIDDAQLQARADAECAAFKGRHRRALIASYTRGYDAFAAAVKA